MQYHAFMNYETEHRRKVIEYYDSAQPFYENFWYGRKTHGLHYGFWVDGVSNRQQAITKENEVLADLAGVKPGDRVLDMGSGVGGSGLWLAKYRGAEVVGLNLVHKQLLRGIELAKKQRVSEKLDSIEADFHELPFKSDTFDILWLLESVEHATDVSHLVKEAFRVLRPGGNAIIAGTFRGRDQLSIQEEKQLGVGFSAAGAFNDFRTSDEWEKVMIQAGFENIKNRSVTQLILRSSEEMTNMCRWGLPVAKALSAIKLVSPIIATNNQWGLYQEGLFRSGATSYNILTARKITP